MSSPGKHSRFQITLRRTIPPRVVLWDWRAQLAEATGHQARLPL